VGAFSAGWRIEGLRWTAHEAKALRQQEIAIRAQLAHQDKEGSAYEGEREQSRQDNVQRQEQVRTIYRDKIVPGECAVDPDARGVLESAVGDANTAAAESGK
jgi:hypothetical protein